MRLGDLDALSAFVGDLRSTLHKEQSTFKAMTQSEFEIKDSMLLSFQYAIDNAPTVEPNLSEVYQEGHYDGHIEGYTKAINEERPHGECKDCDKCEYKALFYSIGLKDGYMLGEFQLTELRRWLTSQGYSEGTVDDKINEFTRFVEKIRGEEE